MFRAYNTRKRFMGQGKYKQDNTGWIAMTTYSFKGRKKISNHKGFTMVELIVVIVIILVLAAVLVPSLLKYIGKSQEAVCKQNRASLYTEICSAFAIGDYDSLKDAFDGIYSKERDDFCPQNGDYTFETNIDESGDVFSGVIICSVHDGDGGSDQFKGRDAAGHLKVSMGFGVDTVNDPQKADKALNTAFLKKYEGRNPSLSEYEKSLFDKIDATNIKKPLPKETRDLLAWEPRVASNGDILMVARKKSTTTNWSTYMVYYEGSYYYHTNGTGVQESSPITDGGIFDVRELNNEKEGQKGLWIKVEE